MQNIVFRLIVMIILLGMCSVFIGENKVENIYFTRAKEMGYTVTEIDKNNFVIEEGATRFYYKKRFLLLYFNKFETDIPSNEKLVGGVLTVTKESRNEFTVCFENEHGMDSFYCENDFSDALFEGNVFKDPLSKIKDSYDSITKNYMSQEQLTSTYERGMEILNSLKK